MIFTGFQPAGAAELTGSLTGDVYSWKSENEDHIRPYVSFRANLLTWKTQTRSLSFHTYTRWKSDWQDKTATDPQFFVYDAYLKFKCKSRRVSIYAGRQFVYSASGSALIDGARFKYAPVHDWEQKLEIDFFGGSRVNRLDPEDVASFSDFAVLGGQAYYQKYDTRLGLSWMRRMNDGFVTYHRMGISASLVLGDEMKLYGRFSVNPEIWEPSEAVVRVRHTLESWYFSGEYLWRDPSVSYNSIFSLIDYKRYKEVRVAIRRKINRDLAVFGTVRTDIFSDEESWATSFGVRTRYFSAAWAHKSGYGGDTDGLTGSAAYQIRSGWQVFGRVNVSQYRIQEEQDDRSEAYSTGLGISKRFGSDWQLRAEWQYLRNAVQDYDSRFHLRVTKGFAFK
jgi:hypothetical protein